MRAPTLSVALLLALVVGSHEVAAAQSIADRLKRAGQDAANAGKKGVTSSIDQQVNSAVENVALQDVADGAFTAVLTPWSSPDNSKRSEIARYNGQAYSATTATGRQIVLCDNTGTVPWQVTVTIGKTAAGSATTVPTTGRGGAAPASGTTTGRSTATPASGTTSAGRGGNGTSSGRGATASSGGRGAATPAANGTASGAGGQASSTPSIGGTEYRFPNPAVTIALPTVGAKAGVPGGGNLRVGDLSETIFTGLGKVRYLRATIPGDKSADTVDFGVSFKARNLTTTQVAGGCAAIAKLNLPPLAASPSHTAEKDSSRASGDKEPTTSPSAAAPADTVMHAGDMLSAKIDQVKLLADPKDDAKSKLTLKKTDQLVFLGDEQNGFIHVQGSSGEGWVRKVLMIKVH